MMREIVGSVVMPASILPCCSAAMNVSPAPTATGWIWSTGTPFLMARNWVRPWVPDPMEVTPRFLPEKSAGDFSVSAALVDTTSASPGAINA